LIQRNERDDVMRRKDAARVSDGVMRLYAAVRVVLFMKEWRQRRVESCRLPLPPSRRFAGARARVAFAACAMSDERKEDRKIGGEWFMRTMMFTLRCRLRR